VFEQRLLLDALLALRDPGERPWPGVPAAATPRCIASTPAKLVAGGQSMGGMYTNLFGAVEPRVPVLVPTGAGGLLEPDDPRDRAHPEGARGLLASALQVRDRARRADVLAHPGMSAARQRLGDRRAGGGDVAARRGGRCPATRCATSTSRWARTTCTSRRRSTTPRRWPTATARPAPSAWTGDAARPWRSTSLGGVVQSYPVARDQAGPGGAMTTRVVVQFESDGIVDSHYIYRQLEEVKHQYGCFFDSYLRTGTPTVVAPAPLTAPCQ
jgi:hypothetical protein